MIVNKAAVCLHQNIMRRSGTECEPQGSSGQIVLPISVCVCVCVCVCAYFDASVFAVWLVDLLAHWWANASAHEVPLPVTFQQCVSFSRGQIRNTRLHHLSLSQLNYSSVRQFGWAEWERKLNILGQWFREKHHHNREERNMYRTVTSWDRHLEKMDIAIVQTSNPS